MQFSLATSSREISSRFDIPARALVSCRKRPWKIHAAELGNVGLLKNRCSERRRTIGLEGRAPVWAQYAFGCSTGLIVVYWVALRARVMALSSFARPVYYVMSRGVYRVFVRSAVIGGCGIKGNVCPIVYGWKFCGLFFNIFIASLRTWVCLKTSIIPSICGLRENDKNVNVNTLNVLTCLRSCVVLI